MPRATLAPRSPALALAGLLLAAGLAGCVGYDNGYGYGGYSSYDYGYNSGYYAPYYGPGYGLGFGYYDYDGYGGGYYRHRHYDRPYAYAPPRGNFDNRQGWNQSGNRFDSGQRWVRNGDGERPHWSNNNSPNNNLGNNYWCPKCGR
jgi:hypothetical protein